MNAFAELLSQMSHAQARRRVNKFLLLRPVTAPARRINLELQPLTLEYMVDCFTAQQARAAKRLDAEANSVCAEQIHAYAVACFAGYQKQLAECENKGNEEREAAHRELWMAVHERLCKRSDNYLSATMFEHVPAPVRPVHIIARDSLAAKLRSGGFRVTILR